MKTTLNTPLAMRLKNNFLPKMCYLLLLFSGMAFGQIVNITDANFKATLLSASTTYQVAHDINGNFIPIDINNDGEIQLSEAMTVYQLSIHDSQIYQITGIEAFQNLQSLDCSNTSISALDAHLLVNLKSLRCSVSSLNAINVSGLINLENLNCPFNHLTSLDLSNLPNLRNVDCSNNLLNNINLTNSTSLYKIICNNNLLTTVDFQGLTNLTILYFWQNNITSLSLNGLTNLNSVIFHDNQLSNLEINNCPHIESADFHNNQLSGISITGNTDINGLYIGNNHFTNVDFSSLLPSLKILNCSSNLITNLDIVGSIVNLETLNCSNTLIISLNLSNNHNFISLRCTDNPNLISVNLKFSRESSLLLLEPNPLSNNPNLRYVCVDDFSISAFTDYFIQNNMNNVVVNSYCSFTPGGNYKTITGSMLFDANSNGCDANDFQQPNIRININDGTTQGATFTNNTGNYNFYTQNGSFVLTPSTENSTWFTFSPLTATIAFADNNNNTANQNFCITANGTHTDVEVVIEPITTARPGFDAVYKIVYKNKGNQPVSANVNFNYNDAVLDFVSATVAPSTQTTGVLNFGFSNLLPFENRSFYITLHVNTPTDTQPVNIGDVLNFNVLILNIGDENPLDNTFTYNQTVVGSFDPNNITCLEGDIAPLSNIGSYLHYGVNFENTGTYPAENIVVKTIIDTTKYDINSLQMLNTSNPAYTRITGNIVEFIFKHITLATGGHGNVLFKIRTLNSLFNGDMVSREAGIFFDYNAPVSTGNANTTFQTLNNGQFVLDNSIIISPNPTSSIINIKGRSVIKSIQVYDIQGRLLETKLIEEVAATIDLSDKTNGIYFFKITTEKGSKVEKIIKE